jgi:lipopolysaccharide/colanic/teichoic acid biosynthesis glycosyltransferase
VQAVQAAPGPVRPPRLKRALDLGLATVLLLPGLPAAALIVGAMGLDMLVRRGDRGRLLYRERRVSAGREFDLLKFRTLRRDALERMEPPEPRGHARLLEADPANLTWAGRHVLKPWYLDELPQLLNVLRGDMSLVGPRPWPTGLVAAQVARGVDYRLHVRAGWTGPAQVSKGEVGNFEALDVAYVERLRTCSGPALVRHDLAVLRRTVRTLLRGEGLRY